MSQSKFSQLIDVTRRCFFSTEEKTYAGGGSTLKASYGAKSTDGHTGEVFDSGIKFG